MQASNRVELANRTPSSVIISLFNWLRGLKPAREYFGLVDETRGCTFHVEQDKETATKSPVIAFGDLYRIAVRSSDCPSRCSYLAAYQSRQDRWRPLIGLDMGGKHCLFNNLSKILQLPCCSGIDRRLFSKHYG